MSQPDISAVILCYGAGERIRGFLDRVIVTLDGITSQWQLILVGNYIEGKEDDTPRIVREIAAGDPRIHAVTKCKKGWYGWDARSGLEECAGKVICYIDGDEQMLAEDIGKAYKFLVEGDADVVMPYRRDRQDSWLRRVNSRVYNLIYNLLFPGYPIYDVHSKPKLFKEDVFRRFALTANDWFLDAEILIQCRRYKLKLIQFPTVFHRAGYRKSFVRFDTIFEFLRNLLRARIREFFPVEPMKLKNITTKESSDPIEIER